MTVTQVTGKVVGVETAVGLGPAQGPKSVTRTIDFSVFGTSPKTENLVESQFLGKFDFIQSIYVDNSTNPAPLSVTCFLTEQTLTWPAFSQGFQTLLSPRNGPVFKIETNGSVAVNLIYLSMMVPSNIWFPLSGGSLGIDYSANKPALGGNLITTIPSGAQGGVYYVQNQDANQIQLLLDDGAGNNQTIILLESGGADATGGGTWQDTNFKGRVRVYSSNPTARVAACVH
jgi:hypothetical protein